MEDVHAVVWIAPLASSAEDMTAKSQSRKDLAAARPTCRPPCQRRCKSCHASTCASNKPHFGEEAGDSCSFWTIQPTASPNGRWREVQLPPVQVAGCFAWIHHHRPCWTGPLDFNERTSCNSAVLSMHLPSHRHVDTRSFGIFRNWGPVHTRRTVRPPSTTTVTFGKFSLGVLPAPAQQQRLQDLKEENV